MCLYCDCITSGPAVLIGLDALRNSKSNEMRSFQFVAEELPHLVLSIILCFHALTGCNTILHMYLYLAKARIHTRKCSLSMPIFLLE